MSESNIIHITITNEYRNLVNKTRLKKTVKSVLTYFKKNSFELTVSIVNNKKIRELNNKFRLNDSETDVLSFSANEIDPETSRIYIGDILVSYPLAKKQSEEMNHQITEELDLLTIHGVLHLLGYDHASKDDEEQMFSVQSKLLQFINNPSMNTTN